MTKKWITAAVLLSSLCGLLLQGCSRPANTMNAAQSSAPVSGDSSAPSESASSFASSAAAPTSSADQKDGPEKAVLEAYNSSLDSKEKVPAIIKQLDGLDWGRLDKVTSEPGKSLEIIEYLAKNDKDIPIEQYSLLFQAVQGLDGALAESYSAMAGDLYTQHQKAAVKAISEITDQAKQKQIISLLAYALSYKDINQEKKSVQAALKANDLDEQEQAVLAALLDNLDHPY
ncbi:hypothetical protein [Paenibacillus pinistramenti]|uniref:hypothetical protein n=1 Tax=Paenibacillus pinistramenti TaxID=1768003 RepID=UPI0011080FFC|nr:hypothetical protein [Paenibacillus pinistramenti]